MDQARVGESHYRVSYIAEDTTNDGMDIWVFKRNGKWQFSVHFSWGASKPCFHSELRYATKEEADAASIEFIKKG